MTIDPNPAGPLQLVKRAIEAKRAGARDEARGRGRPYDQIWCIFDRDEHPNFDEAVSLAAVHGINLAISNPCIELWFILHFEDRAAFINRNEAQRRAAELLKCRKVLAAAALDRLIERYPLAADRARKLDSKHRDDGSAPGTNPSSGCWRLIDEIRGC
jgi:hypothetical protein